MNTNTLKKFAQDTRNKLMQQVRARLELVLTTDSAELREKATALKKLQEAINNSSKEQVVDKIAYTWFNRLMALRFMDANDYQPIGVSVITPKAGYTLPELLDEAKQGTIPDDLKVNTQQIYDLLDGKIPSTNAQNEAYKILLIAACNHLHTTFPFLFERLNDYAELLLPDDLTSEFSIVQDMREGMTNEDCQEVEIIGWLYQFYISEWKEELINAKKKYKVNEIAPVTQLFTPKWIVQYMVDNTLGQYWKEARPNTSILGNLEFYIKPANPELIPNRQVKSPEDIKFFDPCVGSAHVLCYAFDIFYKIYEEEGYNPSEIPELILTKNLFGIDIDDRAAQLAGFALMMKGRQYHRRFLRKQVFPNVTAYQNFETHPKFENAKVHGSLIKINKEEVAAIKVDTTSLFAERNEELIKQAKLLSDSYDIIVTNPPYLNSSYMEVGLKQFIGKEYKETKSDLFAAFVVQSSNLTKKDGLIGFICPYVWMFIKSYEWLRKYVIANTTISTLVQLEYNAFGPAVVPIGTFILRNNFINNYRGSYIKLSDFKGVENQKPKTLEAIQNPDCGWFFKASQKDFDKIPGSSIGYWLSKRVIEIFKDSDTIEDVSAPKQGLITGNNERFVRLWYECESKKRTVKWFPFNKGGAIRKWYGNQIHFVNWENNGLELLNFTDSNGKLRSRPQNVSYYFKKSISWTKIGSSEFTVRYYNEKFIFSDAGLASFPNEKNIIYLLGLLNSKIVGTLVSALNPTLNRNIGDINKIPVIRNTSDFKIIELVNSCVDISQYDWNSREISWDFQNNKLLTHEQTDLNTSYQTYCQYGYNQFHQLHQNEEELNRQFIEIYGLEEELTPNVQFKDVTILKQETSIENGKLVFHADEIMRQFISYAVGCMFGRYSLDKEGLVLANQGETLEDYLKAVGKGITDISFMPDDDNIIPILDEDWFTDDIVGRFYEFLKVTFGAEQFEQNLAFVQECIGKDMRKYFVKDFYKDHIKRYKTRPIYWLFASPKGSFSVLIYLHRYTPDTLNQILNDYLKEYRQKLNSRIQYLDHLIETGSSSEQTKSAKEKEKIKRILLELQEYEREVLYPLATERIVLDLDDGVLVNYNKFGKAIKEVKGLNDKKAKAKVRKFDWIDVGEIRD